MKILFLLTQDLNSPSGIGRFFPLAKYLVRQGHQVKIAALHADFASLKEKNLEMEGVQVEYVAQMHVLKQDNQKKYFSPGQLLRLVLQATLALSKAALNTPADIIHICKPHPMNSIAGLLARILQRKILFLDCDDYEAGTGHFSGRWQKSIVSFFEDRMPRVVQHVTTHNTFLYQRMAELGVPPEQMTLLPNGVDVERFPRPNPVEIARLKNELGLHNRKVIGFIGSLSAPSHPVDLLLNAFCTIHKEIPESALLIVGGGDMFENLQQETTRLGIAEATRFSGFIPPSEVSIYYRLADVLVDPVLDDASAKGRLPLKLFESWVSETPFVTSDVGDRRRVLGSPLAGLLVRAGDAEHLAQGILMILADPIYANELRRLGLERCKEYTWERLAHLLSDVYLGTITTEAP